MMRSVFEDNKTAAKRNKEFLTARVGNSVLRRGSNTATILVSMTLLK